MPTEIRLSNHQAPGDALMMTAAIRDLHRCYPGRYKVQVATSAPDLWMYNPYVSTVDSRRAPQTRLGYSDMIKQSNQSGLHFLQGFVYDMNRKMRLNVRLTEFRADLHFSSEELEKPPITGGDYWVILSGGKPDFTTKWWEAARYQEVVNRLLGKVRFVQLGNKTQYASNRPPITHYHPPLDGVINLVGRTTLREAMRVLLHARGVVCPVTCFMHMAAAMGKPAVVIAGGREHWTWEAYTLDTLKRNMAYAAGMVKIPLRDPAAWERWDPSLDQKFVDHPFVPHVFLHTVGQLDCCRHGGCWRNKVVEGRPEQNCKSVVRVPDRAPVPRCLDAITVDQVVEAIERIEREELTVKNVSDLVVHLPNAGAPVPAQPPNPVLHPIHHPRPQPKQKAKPVQPAKPAAPSEAPGASAPALIDSGNKLPAFRHLTFPITVCVVTYGEHAELARRCLRSIYACLDPELFKLRVGMNEPSDGARAEISRVLDGKKNVEQVLFSSPQIYKYPMMRKMFHDPELPISTDWVLWLDDDSHLTSPSWLREMGRKIDDNFLKQDHKYPRGIHMYGKVYYYHLRDDMWDWAKAAKWNTDRPWPKDPTKNPPMDKIDFCTGGFWMVTRQALMDCDWPDPRLKHRGGDIWMGGALYQQGYGVVQSYHGAAISDAKKRGYDEPIAGCRPRFPAHTRQRTVVAEPVAPV